MAKAEGQSSVYISGEISCCAGGETAYQLSGLNACLARMEVIGGSMVGAVLVTTVRAGSLDDCKCPDRQR